MAQPHLSGIYVYPVKSCRRVSLNSAVVSDTGLSGDRQWQVVDESGRGLTQREHKILATVQPLPVERGLQLSAPGMSPIEVGPPGPATGTALSHFGLPVPVVDAGDEAADWFSELLSESTRLVAMASDTGWRLPGHLDIFGQGAPFSDAAPILVTTVASLTWLQERASAEFGMDRFRSNLVIDGTPAWAEDTWATFWIGGAELRGVLPWPRCTIPQIDQDTAARHKEPAKVLKAHRWCAEAPTVPAGARGLLEGNALFGVACSVQPSGARLSLQDPVEITQTSPPVLAMA